MYIERFFVPGLAHASYLMRRPGTATEAVVVDPERNVEGYAAYLTRHKLKLIGIFLTPSSRGFRRRSYRAFCAIGAPILFRKCTRDVSPRRHQRR